MTTETVLTDAQCLSIGAFGQSPLKRLDHARAIEQAVLQSPEIQALRNMLYEARCQLPLAAQFWNEDDDQDRSRWNVQHVMGLIKRIDSALEKQL